jgi:hypothetical protein
VESIRKYPRTHHLEGSRRQPGDEDLDDVPFRRIAGRSLLVEEKMDGANAGISFDAAGRLRLQSRGHYLSGGPRERHWDRFKQWAQGLAWQLWPRLGDRYVLYGEWLYAKHTVFYDALPHHFLEFDLLDIDAGAFLDTPRRAALLAGTPVHSVHVLHQGMLATLEELTRLVGPSRFIRPGHRERLRQLAVERGLDPERLLRETDPTPQMEGLYVKVEEDGFVRERYKWIRPGFLSTVLASESHWLNRPILPNQLQRDGAG